MARDNAAKDRNASYRPHHKFPESSETTCHPVRAAEPQDLRPSDAVTKTASNCS
jgi:hypothetical protein